MQGNGKLIWAPVAHETSNTKLAAALTALGIGLNRYKRVEKLVGDVPGGVRYVWYLDPVSACGKFNTAEMIAHWHTDGWENGSEHPLAYIKAAFQNEYVLVGKIKDEARPVAVIQGKYHTALVGADLAKANQDKILRWLK